jgi:alpha-glucosidase
MTSLLVMGLSFVLLVNARTIGRLASRQSTSLDAIDSCPGYSATNIKTTPFSLTADLTLAGKPCNVFGQDIVGLKLSVLYEDGILLRQFHPFERA